VQEQRQPDVLRIAATIVNEQVTLENGVATGNAPGQLLRGPGARVA
jgi:hypothetical protein